MDMFPNSCETGENDYLLSTFCISFFGLLGLCICLSLFSRALTLTEGWTFSQLHTETIDCSY